MNRRHFLLIAAACVIMPTIATAAAAPISDEDKEQFLQQAEIIKKKGAKAGTTGTSRLTLRHGDVTHDVHLQTIDVFKNSFQTAAGMELNFRDSYKFNIAAYQLDRLINLNMVPVSVERKFGRGSGSFTWWVDDVQMMEAERYKKKISAPNHAAWLDQMANVRVFNELVYNTDPNLGNLLITNDWGIRLIDFSRGFRTSPELRHPENLGRVDQRVYDGLLARRNAIVRFFEKAIAEKGEGMVICKLEGH